MSRRILADATAVVVVVAVVVESGSVAEVVSGAIVDQRKRRWRLPGQHARQRVKMRGRLHHHCG